MIVARILYLVAKLTGKEAEFVVIAMFLAQRIILGKLKFKDVPAPLKPRVREILEESGLGDLATEGE